MPRAARQGRAGKYCERGHGVSEPTERLRVVIAEDAALFRAGLVRLIEDHGHRVCAAVADGDSLLAAVAEHQPDVAVADIRMPPTHTD